MPITKEVSISQMTILADGQIQIQEKTSIIEDGVELSSSFHREVLDPATDVGNTDSRGKTRDKRIMDLVGLVHTPAVKTKRKAALAAQSNKPVA